MLPIYNEYRKTIHNKYRKIVFRSYFDHISEKNNRLDQKKTEAVSRHFLRLNNYTIIFTYCNISYSLYRDVFNLFPCRCYERVREIMFYLTSPNVTKRTSYQVLKTWVFLVSY